MTHPPLLRFLAQSVAMKSFSLSGLPRLFAQGVPKLNRFSEGEAHKTQINRYTMRGIKNLARRPFGRGTRASFSIKVGIPGPRHIDDNDTVIEEEERRRKVVVRLT